MKSIYRHKTNKIIALAIIVISIGFFGVITQGCNNETIFDDENSLLKDDFEFLDLSVPDVHILSDKEIDILNKAFQRIDPYLVVKNDTCYLTIHSAEDVNMSNRLFSLVKERVAMSNIRYKVYISLKNSDLNITVVNPFEINTGKPRLRSGESETTNESGLNWSCTTTHLSHEDVTVVINAMRTANGSATAFGSIVAGLIPGAGVASVLLTAYGYLNDTKFSKIQDDYAKSGSTEGIILQEITTRSPTTGVSFTSYSAYYSQ